MPIDLEELLTEDDELMILPTSTTLAEAAEALVERDGDDTWALVVVKGGGAYVLGTFADLRRAVERAPDPTAAFAQTLDALDLIPLEAVQQRSMSTDEAFDKANYETEAKALLVLRGDAILGLLTEKETRAAEDAFVAASLINLYLDATGPGEVADTSDWAEAADDNAFGSSGEGQA